jgi:hypothetical protein
MKEQPFLKRECKCTQTFYVSKLNSHYFSQNIKIAIF